MSRESRMNLDRDAQQALASARRLHRQLRALGDVAPPPSLFAAVLDELGFDARYFSMESPIGPVFVASAGQRVSAVMRAPDDAHFEQAFRARFGRAARRAETAPLDLVGAIARHLRGEPAGLDFDLRSVSEFERAVLLKALEIPRGEVRPYGWIAREIGRPGAVRAVGSALNKNPIPLLIPCHRVVRSDGHVGEYAYGTDAKTRMLAYEGLDTDWLTRLAQARTRFIGNTETGYFCLPTCRSALAIPEQARRPFSTASAAYAAGLSACSACRPVAEAV
jgi:methylated-DNA-[protein]-cysteine S-methyltransferase